ncbi:hypothetical protein ABWH96_10835 [Marivirga tractuosa]|uniref:hypothetical protein n=1 Tax=Marivirga tractuosa TaxID=1006 RepID=UPI0035CF2CA2
MDFFTSKVSIFYYFKEYLPKFFNTVQVLAFIILLFSVSFTSSAQNSEVSVNVQVLPPYSNNIYDYIGADDKISRSFQEQILVTLRNQNPSRSYEIKLIGSVLGNNGVEASMNQNFQPFQRIILPAGEMKVISGRDLANINRNLTEADINSEGINSEQIRRTGNLPEGNYRICFQAFDFQTGESLSSSQPLGCSAPITISNPDPPVIAYPFHESVILATSPQGFNISWAPVQLSIPRIRYRIKIVELSDINANPYDLMERTNVAYYREDNLRTNSVFYGQGKPPLTVGKTYAIRVQSYDPLGEIDFKNNGYSEINTFRYANSYDDGSGLSDMDFVNLVPGYVKLIDLDELDYTKTGGVERFNGLAKIAFINPLTEKRDVVNVNVNNLSLKEGNRQNPEFMGGEIDGNLSELPELLGNLDGFIQPSAVNWNYESGLNLTGSVELGDGSKMQVQGGIQLTPAGAIGQLRAGGNKEPIYEIDEEEINLKITEVVASFPENTVEGKGYLEFFGSNNEDLENKSCEINNIDLLQDQTAISVSCSYNSTLPLVENSDNVMLQFEGASGSIVAKWNTGTLDYNVQLLGALDLKYEDETHNCDINLAAKLTTESSPQFNVLGNNCQFTDRSLSLGLVQLNLRDMVLEEISYQKGIWDFELAMNGNFILPMFDNWTSPEVENIIIDKEGITISEQIWSLTELQGLQNIGWDSIVSLSPDQLRFDAITYPWYEDLKGQGPWNMSAVGKASIQNMPIIPCLDEYDYDFSLYYNSEDGINGELEGKGEGCNWGFSRGSSLTISRMKGELFAEVKNENTVKSASLELTGSLNNNFLFDCEKDLTFDNVFLNIDKEFVRGSIEQFTPNCPINIGPFAAEITNSKLTFDVSDGDQEVLLDASADLILPDKSKVEGTFLYDLVEGEFIEIEFELDDPFTWNIPEEEPVLSFYIEEALINQDGFLIDGRNTLKLPGGKDIDATFDNLTLDINTMQIEKGQVIFDESFAFEAGIDTTDYSLKYKAVEQGKALSLNPALYFSLGANVSLDSKGLKTGGDAEARLILGDQNFTEDLSVHFSDDFTFGLYPFNVSIGKADLLVGEQLIAYINDQGLTIDPTDFILDALPDKLPLPDNDVAYLKIRDVNGNLLIDAQNMPNGNISIETLPGKNLEFYLPAIDQANPPVFGNVQLDNVQLNADVSNPSIAQGTVTIDVPANMPALTGLELPIQISQIAFGTNLFGSNTQGLHLSGDLNLFDTVLPDAGTVSLQVDNKGYATANFNISGQDLLIPLVHNSDIVTYRLNNLSGRFESFLDNISAQSFSLDLSGKFSVNDQQTTVATADLDLHLEPGSFQVTHFSSSIANNPIDLDFGNFGLKIKEIPALPVFNYTDAGGFDFAAELNLEMYIDLADGQRFELPMDGLEIRPSGLHIPAQNINLSSIPGLSIPPVDIAGFELELLALRTDQSTVFDWYNLTDWNFSPSLDLAVRMPNLAAKGLNLPDGLSFYDVSIQDGVFSGTMPTLQPPNGLNIKLGNLPDAPDLNISQIGGELLPDANSGGQGFNFDLEGKLLELPGFKNTDAQACVNPEFSLSIIEGSGFEGTITNFTPCGNLEIGPFTLTPQNSELLFAYQNSKQEVSLDGTIQLDLKENPSPNGLANGNVKLNLLNGSLMGGYVQINKSFPFEYPVGNPLLSFTLNDARLDTTGFTMQGSGALNMDNLSNTVSFNALKLSLNDLSVKSGSANLGSDLNLDLNLSPFGLSLTDINAQRPASDHLRMSFNADVLLTKDGIGYSGSSVAAIRFGGENFQSLRAEFLNSFAFNPHNLSVSKGKAEFYLDENDQQATDPLAILDANGFSIGGGIVSMLPDTLGLPTKDVAYIILKDSQGNSLINANQNSTNGWDINTKTNQPLTLVIPSLANGGNAPETQVSFSLTTDSNFNPSNGNISLESAINLEPNFQLPIELTSLSLIAQNQTEISAEIKVNLPESLSDEAVTSVFKINNNGFKQASLEWGTYTQTYNSSVSPAFTQSVQGTLPNDNQQTNMSLHLYGIKADLGVNTSLQLAGGLESDLLSSENQSNDPLFFYADYNNQNWTGGVDASHLTNGIEIGKLTLTPDPQQPFELQISTQQFLIKVDGIIDFEELVGESLRVSVEDLQIGMDYSQSNPSPVFGMGGGSVTLPDQVIDLFSGEVILTLSQPNLQISGQEITINSDGEIDIFEEDVDFNGLSISSNDGFDLGTVQMDKEYELVRNYANLSALGISQEQNTLSLSATIDINLPVPVESTASAIFTISRNSSNNQVNVDVDGPDFEIDKRYALGDFAEFELSKVTVDINPSNLDAFGIYAAGNLLIDDQPRIYFGNESSIRTNPGIAYANRALSYNATGNAAFNLDEGFFDISVNANMSVASASRFEVELGGNAGVNIDGVEGSLEYEGFTIGKDGIINRGNLTGGGTLTLMNYASLTIGEFIYEVPNEGESTVTVDLPVSNDDPESFDSQENPDVAFSPTEVKRYVRFGGGSGTALELTLGGKNPDEDGSGGFGGGVDEVMFYELPNGDKYLKIDNANLAIGRTMTCSAFMEYKEENGGFILRATATAELGVGNTSAKAALAGYFANLNNQLKFGLFVGVEVSTGIPLFPGVIDLKGGGAGFFYKPTSDDLDLITNPNTGALKVFGHKMVRNELENPVSPPSTDLDFAVMLFAQVGILGSAGTYSLEGSTFIQITDKSVYLDAQGVVLGLDGAGSTKLKLEGGAYVQSSFEHFFIDGGGYVDLKMPVVLDGNMELMFFFAEDPGNAGEVIWAIDGDLEVEVYSILTMKGTIIACPSGLYMDASVKADIIDVWPIKVNAKLMGSVWYANDDSFRYPFGAYMTMKVEICLGFCVEPTAKAAFATLSGGGFELVVGAQACVGTPFGDACLHGIAKASSSSGFDVDISTGKMNARLFDEAEGMKKRFEDMVAELKEKVNATKDAIENLEPEVPNLEIPNEVLAKAGFNFHTNEFSRFLSAVMIRQNINEVISPMPPDMQWVYDNIVIAGSNSNFPMDRLTEYGDEYNAVKDQKDIMKKAMDTSTLYLEEAIVRMEQVKGAAYEYNEKAQEAFDEMITALESSPVVATNLTIQQTQNGEITSSPNFTIDEETAANQNEKSSNSNALDNKLLEQFEEAILATEKNLAALDSMLSKPLQKNTTQSTNSSNSGGFSNSFQQNGNNVITVANTTYNSNYYNTSNINLNLNIFSPSVSDVTASLRKAIEEIDKYYAYEGSFRARQHLWMSYARRSLVNQHSIGISNDFDDVWTEAQSKSDNYLESNMKDRVDLLYRIANESAQVRQTEVNNTQLSEANFKTSLEYLWYDMHDLGLEKGANEIARTLAPGLADDKAEVSNIVDEPYKLLTDKIDDSYTLKSEILTLLHGLYTQYDKYRQAVDSTSTSGVDSLSNLQQDIETRLSHIEESLQPPVINNINVFSVRTFYRNKARINWSANKNPVETSFQFEEVLSGDNNIATGFYDYRTLGNKEKVFIHSYKNYYPRIPTPTNLKFYETKEFSIGFRLRGKGGLTAIRRANFRVAVGANSDESSVQWASIKEEDNTPPKIDFVEFHPDYHETNNHLSPYEECFYTKEQQTQVLQVVAGDDQSDIVKFEYAVGSNEGQTDIQDWGVLTGSTNRQLSSRYQNGQNEDVLRNVFVGSINSLSLQPDKRYYFSVRVTNGEGLTTTVSMQKPLMYDGTPPSKPAPQYTIIGFQTLFFGNSIYPSRIKPLANSAPDYRPLSGQIEQIYSRLENNTNMPEVDFKWSASTDQESGIFTYEYYVSKDSVLDKSNFVAYRNTEETSKKIRANSNQEVGAISSDKPLVSRYSGSKIEDYGQHYFYVRAINNASSKSEVAKLGPFTPKDPTAPDIPDMQVTERPNALRIHIIENSFDPESGLKGYQYALGTSTNTADLQGFANGDEVNWEYSNYDALLKGVNFNFSLTEGSSGPEQPTFDIEKNNLPKGEPIYVFFRAVNQQGMKSGIVACGPIILDDTPPETPDVSLTTTSDNKVKIELNDVHDPESGISKVVYKVYWTRNTLNKSTDHITGFEVSSPSSSPRNFTFYKYLGNYDSGSIEVVVWIYNGRGEYTRSSKSIPLQILNNNNNSYQGNLQFNSLW